MSYKKLFIPIINNGMNLVRANYTTCLLVALSGRPMVVANVGYPYPDGSLNIASACFLKSDCDTMLVIDGDMLFEKADVDRLLAHDLPLVFGAYCKKTPGMHTVLQKFEDRPLVKNERGLWSVKAAARGFMAMKREVLESLKPHCQKVFCASTGQEEYEFWRCLPGGHSEDYAFCNRWRELGNEVLVDPDVFVRHVGDCAFPLNSEIEELNKEQAAA